MDLKAHLVSTPLPHAEASLPRPTWPLALPGMGHINANGSLYTIIYCAKTYVCKQAVLWTLKCAGAHLPTLVGLE